MDTRSVLLSDAIELYVLDCQAQRFAARTVETAQFRLRTFLSHAGDLPLDQITANHIRTYQVALQKRDYAAGYQHGLMRGLRAFLNYCVRDDLLLVSPMAKVKMPRNPEQILPAVSEADIRRAVTACEYQRDRAILLFIAASGVRRAELCALNIEDVDIASGAVQVRRGKGGRPRTTYIDADARKTLKRYMLERKQAKPKAPLFASMRRTEGRMTINSLTQTMERISNDAQVHVACHALRRSFAMRCLRARMNIHVIARLMGHSDIDVLKLYLPMLPEDIAREYQQLLD